jgi:DNA-binding NarL/FixJ family response regulator
MNVLLIEDHPIVREGCRRLLAGHDTDVTEAATAAEGLRLCAETDPDIVILDLNLPDASGFDVLRDLLRARADRRIIVFSMYEDAAFVTRAMAEGASGYVTKSDDPDALAEALAKVASGEIYLGATAAKVIAMATLRPARASRENLSPRERQVLDLLGEGNSLAQIADRLGLSYRTGAALVAQLRTKLDAGSTAALIKLAVEARQRAP